MDIVVLAGGRCDPELAVLSGQSLRALVPYRGRPMLEIVLEAVIGLGRVIVVGGPESAAYESVPAGKTFTESLTNGLGSVRSETCLLCTADLPLLTSEAVRDFVGRCSPEALLNYAIVPAERCAERFPGMKRTTLRLREGRFTGGNIALCNTAALRAALPILERAYAARKSPLQLARLVGFRALSLVAIGAIVPRFLSVSALERCVSRIFGGQVRAVRSEYPEIGVDIDSADQYRYLLSLKNPVVGADHLP